MMNESNMSIIYDYAVLVLKADDPCAL
jgi:hypothetical protein